MRRPVAFVLAFGLLASGSARAQGGADLEAQVNGLFTKWTADTPGCAVGVSVDEREVLARAYGMADLEHDVPNTPATIFESGSVAKQFTAAAVLLLAKDGKLAVDDPVRKYIPELPDYGVPLTIRHMLTHTSGLRDWGNIAAIGGWPRGARTHTHAHVLDIVSRQRALNFTPGTRYSYSNTGYNLAAILVERVSGMSFAEFTRRQIFEPLGMSRTSWRDDYTRIVKDRAIAYAEQAGGFRQQMPFEHVHGNGGMLTTAGDLLKWAHNFTSPKVGDTSFVRDQVEPGRFTDGRSHGYALGLGVGTYRGLREISHGGATAAYRAYLSIYPDERVSVAVLCNVASAPIAEYAYEIGELYLAGKLKPVAERSSRYTLTAKDYDTVTGVYRNSLTGEPLRVNREGDAVRIDRGPVFVPMSAFEFTTVDGAVTWEMRGTTAARAVDAFGTVTLFEKVTAVRPSASELQGFAGTYVSNEAEASMTAVVENGGLVLRRRPATTLRLLPIYPDAFSSPELGTVIFRRGSNGRVVALSVVQDRVWDLRFEREEPRPVRTN